MLSRIAALVVALSIVVSACSQDSRIETLEANPMANASLTFAEPSATRSFEFTTISNFPNPAGGGVVVEVTFSPIPSELIDQGLEELTEQAEVAGFNLRQGFSGDTSESGPRQEVWESFNDQGERLSILLTENSITVELLVEDESPLE